MNWEALPLYLGLGYLACLNLAAFAVYGWDKSCARRGRRRVREATLLLLAVLGGSAGAILGMCLFRHKTRHLLFALGLPLILLAQLLAAAAALWW